MPQAVPATLRRLPRAAIPPRPRRWSETGARPARRHRGAATCCKPCPAGLPLPLGFPNSWPCRGCSQDACVSARLPSVLPAEGMAGSLGTARPGRGRVTSRPSRKGMVQTVGYLQKLQANGVDSHSYTEEYLALDRTRLALAFRPGQAMLLHEDHELWMHLYALRWIVPRPGAAGCHRSIGLRRLPCPRADGKHGQCKQRLASKAEAVPARPPGLNRSCAGQTARAATTPARANARDQPAISAAMKALSQPAYCACS
jgi:hypothetical protein